MGDGSTSAVKILSIQASVRYPVVSAYEFEFLKKEADVLEFLKPCTLYMIVQRPLMVIDGLSGVGGVVQFSINDDTSSPPLVCSVDLYAAGILDPAKDVDFLLHAEFFKVNECLSPPFNEVAGFKIIDVDGGFKYWLTAERFIYHLLKGTPGFSVQGDIGSYMDYEVHYIGKAFDQRVWERLTGHESMQRILTLEPGRNVRALGAPFEISLLMLEITGATEGNVFPYMGFPNLKHAQLHELSDDASWERFFMPWVNGPCLELTNEAEAMLVSSLKPSYNTIFFDNYPKIKSGARSLGYSDCTLSIDLMPATLRTKNSVVPVFIGNGEFAPV